MIIKWIIFFFFETLNLYVALGKLNKYTCKGQHAYFLSTTFGTCIPYFAQSNRPMKKS